MSTKSKSAAKAVTPEQKSAARRASATKAAATRKANAAAKAAPAKPDVDRKAANKKNADLVAPKGGAADGAVATKRPAGDIVVGDRIGRKMAGPFLAVQTSEQSKGGKTVVFGLSDASSWAPRTTSDVWVLVAKDAPTPEPETVEPTTPIATHSIEDDAAEAAKVLPGYIVNYVELAGSTDAMAPMHGLPFVQAGRLYVQLEGRGGAGKKDDVDATTGLRPFLRATNGGLGDKPKKVLQLALAAIGFERAPFPYVHPDRGSTASSYYSMPLDAFPLKVVAEPRQGKRDAKRAEKVVTTANKDLMVAPVPMRPDGNEKDVERLDELWAKYDEARETWKRAALKRASADKQAEYQQATRDANAELVAHRRAMHAKNVRKAADNA